MTPEEYAAQQAFLAAAGARLVMQLGKFFVNPVLALRDWLSFLGVLFPEVKRLRDESASLGRSFYDSQRDFHHPTLTNVARDLEPYEFTWFVENVEPIRKRLSQEQAPAVALEQLAMFVSREIENGGRKQIIHAVEADEPLARRLEEEPAGTETRLVRGWARVATGRETCAWCLMLISRGPVYLGADTAGLDLPDWEAQSMIAAGEDVSEYMEEWHTGCDCKVVPVFDLKNWPGRDASKRALELWIDATREARQILEDDPGKKSFVGGQWIPTTLNREAINTLRRRLERGDITSTQWAAVAA